jgi:tetratricopeptide (TPR) repeat protein
MKRVQRLSILLIILLFILTALWKFSDQNDHGELQERDDRTELRLFWEHHNHATDFLNSSVYDSAAFYYEKALAINSEHEGVLYYLGSSRLFLREYVEAREHWDKLAEINPLSARARLQLGNLYFCMAPDNHLFEPATAESLFS